MKKLYFSVAAIFIIAVAATVSAFDAWENLLLYQNQSVILVQIGSRVYAGVESPVYAIKFGDTAETERLERYWYKLGYASMNATLYRRCVEGVDADWYAVLYRRPNNDDERVQWAENPQAEKWHKVCVVKKSELPAPFCFLPKEDLQKVESMKIYLDNSGGKIYLAAMDLKEAVAFADKLSSLVKKSA